MERCNQQSFQGDQTRHGANEPETHCHADHHHLMREGYQAPPVRAQEAIIDLGFIHFGIKDGSLQAGVETPIGSVDGSIGRRTGVGAGVDLGPIGSAGGRAGLDLDRDGAHAQVGAGAEVLNNTISGGAQTGGDLGAYTGVRAGAGGNVGPLEANGRTHAYVDESGASVGGKAGARIYAPRE
jgi:hypothetical protein